MKVFSFSVLFFFLLRSVTGYSHTKRSGMFSCISLSSHKVLQSRGSQRKAEYKRIQLSRKHCTISVTGNQKRLLPSLMEEGKTLDLEFQANFAVFDSDPIVSDLRFIPLWCRKTSSCRYSRVPDMQSDLVQIFRNVISSKQLPLQLQRRPGPWLTPCYTFKQHQKEQNPWARLSGPVDSSPCPTGRPLLAHLGLKWVRLPPCLPSEPVNMPVKHRSKSFLLPTHNFKYFPPLLPAAMWTSDKSSWIWTVPLFRRVMQGRGRGRGACSQGAGRSDHATADKAPCSKIKFPSGYEKAQVAKDKHSKRSETEIRSINQHLILSRRHPGAFLGFPI